MANVVAEVTTYVARQVKKGDTTVQAPSKWASDAGFSGSAASSLRAHIARASGNGCGRTGRYPKVSAEGMLELIELGHTFKAAEGAKAATVSKRIGSKLKAASGAGAKQAKATAKATPKTRKPRTKTAA